MLEGYSLNAEVPAATAVSFKNIKLDKCCNTDFSGDSTIIFNKCGVYEVVCCASSATSATIQLYKNGVAQPEAQSTGTSPCFRTFVQVPNNNSCCPCSSPTSIQIMNPTDAAETFTNIDITVNKLG